MEGTALEDEQIGVVCDSVAAANKKFVAVEPAGVVEVKRVYFLFLRVAGCAEEGTYS